MSEPTPEDEIGAWDVEVDGEDRLLVGSPFCTSERLLIAREDLVQDPDALYGPRGRGGPEPPEVDGDGG